MKDRINTLSIREIKHSFKRFLSLIVMSMLGVLVFVGLKMSSLDMLKSLDTYYDNDNHYDIKIVSTLGLTKNDINKVKKIDGVKQVEGAYSKDVIINVNDDESVIKIIGIPKTINKVKNLKGKMPKENNEILVEQNMLDEQKLKIGDSISITDDDFKEKTFKIVGTIKSSMFISSTTGALNRGNTTLGSGHISYYTYCLNSNFNIDYYTEIYVTVNGAKKLITDSNKYNNITNKTFNKIDDIKSIQAQARYDEIYNKINDEIKSKENEGLSKLNAAKSKLDSANYQLVSNKKELDNASLMLDNAKKELDNNKNTLDNAKQGLDTYNNELVNANNKITDAKQKINEALKDYHISYDDVKNLIDILKDNEITKEEAISLIPKDIDNYEDVINAITSIYDSGLIDDVKNYVENNITKEELINLIPQDVPYYDEIVNFINDLSKEEIINYITNVDNIDKLIEKIPVDTPYYDEIVNLLNDYKESISKIVELVKSVKEIQDAEEKYKENVLNYNKLLGEYNKGQAKYLSYYKEYQDNFDSYNNGLKAYNSALSLYNKNVKEYYDQLNMFKIKIADAKGELDKIPKGKWYVYKRLDDSEYTSFIDDGKSVSNLAKLFPTIFFIVAILISLISMSRMVEDDRSEIGTLKSLGFSNKYIRKKYLLYSGIATILGGLLGSVLGFLILPYFIWNIYKILFDVPVFSYYYDPTNSIIGIVIAVICICGMALLTIRKVVKEKPSELLRPKAPSKGKRVILEKIPFIWNNINFSNKITIRNLFRYKKRVFMMVIGILGCTSLLLAGFGIRDGIVDIPEKQYGEVFHFDDIVYLNELDDSNTLDKIFDKDIKNRLDTYMSSSYESGNNSIYLMAVNDKKSVSNVISLKNPKTKKTVVLTPNKVIISEKLSRLINKNIGDKITIKGPNNKEYSFVISNIFENYAGNYVIMDKYTYQNNISDYKINASYVNLKNKNEEETVMNSIMKDENVISVMSLKTTIENVNNMLKSLNSVVLILIVLSGALSFVILYNLSYINISERKRELATLKVLGFTDKEVDNYIVKETIILTIIGIVLGLIFGIFLTNIIIDTIEISQVKFLHKINAISFVITALFILGFTLIVNVITHFALKKIDMIESLKSVE